MPVSVLDNQFGRVEVYSKTDIDNMLLSASSVSASGQATRKEVTSGAWTSDTSGHPRAPLQMYYTDLVHNLGSATAHVAAALGADDFLIMDIQYQKRIDDNTLRVWLRFSPAYAIIFSVYP